MFKLSISRLGSRPWANSTFIRRALPLALLFLLIEFFDELHYGIQSAALPVLRADLALSYAQVGLLLGLPGMLNTFIEPALMLLGDTRLRKALVLGGGLAVVASLLLTAGSASFGVLLLAFVLGHPASGAFVTLSQATLMDLNPGREAQMMARWTAAGSLGNLAGPLLLAGGFALGLGWRPAYLGLAVLAAALGAGVMLARFPVHSSQAGQSNNSLKEDLGALLPNLWAAARNLRLLRWFALLELSDLMLDIFAGYATLYFADVAGLSPAQVGLLLSVMMAASLAGDLLVIPLLEKVPGRWLVRRLAVLCSLLYPALLLIPWLPAKIALAVALHFTTIGWYPVLQGEAYAALPGRSGTVMALNAAGGVAGGALAWLIGWVASRAGLPAAMWLLLAGPLCLALFTPGEPPAP